MLRSERYCHDKSVCLSVQLDLGLRSLHTPTLWMCSKGNTLSFSRNSGVWKKFSQRENLRYRWNGTVEDRAKDTILNGHNYEVVYEFSIAAKIMTLNDLWARFKVLTGTLVKIAVLRSHVVGRPSVTLQYNTIFVYCIVVRPLRQVTWNTRTRNTIVGLPNNGNEGIEERILN